MDTLYTTYYLKEFRTGKDGKAPVTARVTIDGQRTEIPTGVRVTPGKWNADKQKATGTSQESVLANTTINYFHARIVNTYNELTLAGNTVTSQEIKDIITGKTRKKVKLLEMFDIHNKKFKKRVEAGDRAEGSLTKYSTVYSHLSDFLSGKDILIKKVDHIFVDDFHDYLITEKGIGHNTTVKYVRAMNKILKIAHKRGEVLRDPTLQYNGKIKKKDPPFLTQDELDDLKDFELTNASLERIRDFFIFSCYTGLAYIDVRKLNKSDLREISGRKWIVRSRSKTDITSRIPLLKPALELIDKYKAKREDSDDPELIFPVPSNQKVNEYLKVLADLVGIKKKLTFHVARHTFATTVTLANGIDLKSVSTMLGHSTVKQTEHYARMVDERLGSQMDGLDSIIGE